MPAPPMPRSIETLSAFVTAPQLNVAEPPELIEVGETENDAMFGVPLQPCGGGGGGTGVTVRVGVGWTTVIVAERDITFSLPLQNASSRYVIVVRGETAREPFATTSPMVVSSTRSVFVTAHCNVDDVPTANDVGVAVNDATTGKPEHVFAPVTAMVTDFSARLSLPPQNAVSV